MQFPRVRFEQGGDHAMPASLDSLRARGVLFDRPGDPAAESFRLLRTQVLSWLSARDATTFAVTSASAGEGKTRTAINLAVQFAAAVDYTVLLVDANLRAPGLHGHLGWQPMPGLSHYLTGREPLERLLVQPGIERLLVLTAGEAVNNASELLGSNAMGALVDELKTSYPRRIVVFDLPAVLVSTDVLAFSRHVDGLLLVARNRSTHKRSLGRAQALLPQHKLIGVALNDSPGSPEQGWSARRPEDFGRVRRLWSQFPWVRAGRLR